MKLKMSKEVDLENAPIGKLLLILALPAITSQIINALYNMVDRMYIGHIPEIGAASLTGVGVCFPVIMIISAFAFLFGVGGSPRASIFMGKKDNDSAEKVLGNSFISLIIVSLILTVVILIFKTPILYMFGASANTIVYAEKYMTIYAIGTIFVQLTLGLNAFIAAQGFSMVSMFTVIIGALTNIILDPIFIFGFDMGVQGAAFATVISQAISALFALNFLTGKNTVLKLKIKNFKIDFNILLPSIALGIAPFIMQATESVLVLCFNSSLLKYGGDLAVGAMTILSSVMQFAMLPLQGITQGGQPIISYNYGAGHKERIKKAFKLTLICCLSYSTLLWLLAQITPELLISIFTNDAQLMELSVWAIRIYMAGLLLMGAQIACQQTFIAFGKALISTFLAIFRKIILLIPLIYILPLFFENKVAAVFWAEPVADVIAIFTTCMVFVFSSKKILKNMDNNEVINA